MNRFPFVISTFKTATYQPLKLLFQKGFRFQIFSLTKLLREGYQFMKKILTRNYLALPNQS